MTSTSKCAAVLNSMLDAGNNMNFFMHYKTPGTGKCTWPLTLHFGRKRIDNRRYSPLMWATVNRDLPLIQRLLDNLNYFDEDGVNAPTESGFTALMIAAVVHQGFMCVDLISRHAQLNLRDHEGNTALMLAVRARNRIAANVLIFHGCGLDLENYAGETAFCEAVAAFDSEMIGDLTLAGAKTNRIATATEITPLEVAVKAGMREIVLQLIRDCGVDCNTHHETSSPLSLAAYYDHLPCFALLLRAGANVNTYVKNLGTALCIGAYMGNPDLVRLAIIHGARVNVGRQINYDLPLPYEWHNQLMEIIRVYQMTHPAANDDSDSDSDPEALELQRHEQQWQTTHRRMDSASMLLAAAGEDVDSNVMYFSTPEAPKAWRQVKEDRSLVALSREAVRKSILAQHPHTNLFEQVPKLELPTTLISYLLYDQHLDIEGDLEDEDDGPLLSISSQVPSAAHSADTSPAGSNDDGTASDASTLLCGAQDSSGNGTFTMDNDEVFPLSQGEEGMSQSEGHVLQLPPNPETAASADVQNAVGAEGASCVGE